MLSADGNLILVFNGEIFNYRELKRELSDYKYKTLTDSEVILAAWIRWGVDCPSHFKGMFAFAVWDCTKKELFIARDRFGVKPLYFSHRDDLFIFSSELRAILATELASRKVSHASIVDFLRFQTVNGPHTIMEDIHMLMPGEYMLVKTNINHDGSQKNNLVVSTNRYWSVNNKPTRLSPEGKCRKEVHGDIFQLLSQAVEQRMVADVPFGAFLSGGIDSSTMVGL